MRTLVTGAAGFVGRHLVDYLRQCEHDVSALVHPRERDSFLPDVADSLVAVEACDLLDDTALIRAVDRLAPEAVFHLAAFSNPESSLKHARQTFETNILATLTLLEALRNTGHSPRVLLVGSSQQYGHVSEAEQPINESHTQKPLRNSSGSGIFFQTNYLFSGLGPSITLGLARAMPTCARALPAKSQMSKRGRARPKFEWVISACVETLPTSGTWLERT